MQTIILPTDRLCQQIYFSLNLCGLQYFEDQGVDESVGVGLDEGVGVGADDGVGESLSEDIAAMAKSGKNQLLHRGPSGFSCERDFIF